MAELSPQAQAVYDAFHKDWQDEPVMQDLRCLAAGLRAAVEQVIPGNPYGGWRQIIRHDLLAIAHELEQHQ
jgi:hypothetical protein